MRTRTGKKYEVKWNFPQPECSGYDPVEVNAGNIKNYPSLEAQGEDAYGWYYVLKSSISFDVVLHTGASYNDDDEGKSNLNNAELQDAVLKNFNFVIQRPYHDPMNMTLEQLKDMGVLEFNVHTGDDTAEDAPDEAEKTATITITNGWKYNVNGQRMEYKVVQKVDKDAGSTDEEGRIDAPAIDTEGAPEGEGKDYLKITYDNSGTTYASETDAAYEGGRFILTLSGEAVYTGTKVWQDQGVKDVKRPGATLELWRYRNGQDFESATPVRNSRDEIVKVVLDPESKESTVDIRFAADDTRPFLDSLPKYDAEGFRYVYVVKEYLSGENADKYQQVFGEITEDPPGSGKFIIKDTLPEWLPQIEGTTTKRVENNNYLYNGGTLSNCLDVNTDVRATKTWKASSFQAEFDNVVVEMTLQSRPKTEHDDGIWSAATDEDGNEISRIKYGFGEEELAAWDIDATVPKYGLLGRQMEYKWVETAVYQAPKEKASEYTEETLKQWYEEAAQGKKLNNLLDAKTGEFELQQDNRTVKYKSTTIPPVEGEDSNKQIIVNEITDTVDYSMEKKWGVGVDKKDVSFSIFRVNSGGTLAQGTPAYLTFKMDKEGNIIDPVDLPAGVKLEKQPGKDWAVKVSGLPEFDENGAEYRYVMLEDRSDVDWLPTYGNKRDEKGNYETTITNNPGPGERILIRKEWADDSDITHREPVNIEVYAKAGGTEDKKLGEVTLNDENEWSAFFTINDKEYIDKVQVDDIYIKEAEVGADGNKSKVEYADDADWKDPTSVKGTYTGAYHNYEVTYTVKQDVLGEHVFSVRNRRVNDVDITVSKLWKDNNGMLRKALNEAFDNIDPDVKPTLSLRLKFDTEAPDQYEIKDENDKGIVDVGAGQQFVLDNEGKNAAAVQEITFGDPDNRNEDRKEYYFYNIPKYDVNGAVMHYAVEEVWLDNKGEVIQDMDEYLEKHLTGYPKNYPDLEQKLREYRHSITGHSYKVGDKEDGRIAGLLDVLHLRARAIGSDQQTIEFTNRLQGTKTVYWHKLWDDYYAYSNGNRPDIYLDIYQMVHEDTVTAKSGDADNLTQVVEPYIKDYRWDSSVNETFEDEVLDNGNDKNHWHAVLDNLPKYDEKTGREYYYYAVERAKVNIRQFDYADVAYYIAGNADAGKSSSKQKDAAGSTAGGKGTDGDAGSGTDTDWPETVTDSMIKIGTARINNDGEDLEEEYLKYGFNDPAEAYKVPDEYKIDPKDQPHKHYQYPDYMLLEGGYFSNRLDEKVTIEGRKLWQSLPNSWPKTDLPAIKFSVYRSLETKKAAADPAAAADASVQKEFVATLTVKEWADPEKTGTYKFTIDHRTTTDGKPADENGNEVTAQGESAAKLPQYDEQGRRYVYTLVEDSIIWADGHETKVSGRTATAGGAADSDDRAGIFDTTQPGEKNFVATNAYNGVKGSLAVKKIMKLETKANKYNKDRIEYVYPAVKFKLERYYYDEYKDGNPVREPIKDKTFNQEKVLSSEEIKTAHENQTGTVPDADKDYVTGTLTFTGLEKYAPNGSEYLYKITEVKEKYLDGYNTWAAKEDLSKEEVNKDVNKDNVSVDKLRVTADQDTSISLTPAATFLNEFKGNEQEKYPLAMRKIWRDYDNAFELRPETITVTIYRNANSQPGQNNAIRENFATLTLPTTEADKDKFHIEFEDRIKGYKADDIKFDLKEDKYWYADKSSEKCWIWTIKDFERYAPNGMEWQYVIEKSTTAENEVEPYRLDNDNDMWGWWNINDGTVINHPMNPMINSIYTDVPFSKKWQDESGNKITTGYLGDLTATFKLQVKEADSKDSTKWIDADTYFAGANMENGALKKMKEVYGEANSDSDKDGSDIAFTKTITGKATDDKWKGSFKNLPTAIRKNNEATFTKLEYRVVEASFKYGDIQQDVEVKDEVTADGMKTTYDVSKPDSGSGLLAGADFTSENSVTTNKLSTTSLTVQKIWSGDSFNQYQTRPKTDKKDNTWETTFVIQRTTDTGTDSAPKWEKVTDVTLYGKDSEPMKKETITGLPATDTHGKAYTYRARELEPGKDIVENNGDTYYNGAYTVSYDEKTAGTLIATNILKQGGEERYTNYAAEKNWYPKEKPDGEAARNAVFELQYLAKDPAGSDGATIWNKLAEVTLDGTKDDDLVTENTKDKMAYGEDEAWHAVWKNVPLIHPDSYIAEGAAHTSYRVVEVSHTPEEYIRQEAGKPEIDETNKIYTFEFTNIRPTGLTVQKNWIGTEETEKKDVEVGLYRTTDKKDIGKDDKALAVKDKDGKHMTKTLKAPDWKTSFDDLPAYDAAGMEYIYYALELSVGGKPVSESSFGVVYDHDTAGMTKITNAPLTSLTGTKTWLDDNNKDGKRPESLTLTLERRAGSTGDWEKVDAEPVWADKDKDVWTYTYSSLPKLSPDALTYQYRVTETKEKMPEDYEQGSTDKDNSFINIRSGKTDFTVFKHWTYNGTDELPELSLKLYRSTTAAYADDGTEVETETPEPVKNGSNWIYTYKDLDKYDGNGVLYIYWAEEIVPDGYDAKTKQAVDKGTLENIQQGTLMVSKEVAGNLGEKDREFAFRVILKGTSTAGVKAREIDGIHGDVEFNGGKAGFTLKHGESVKITGIPAGLEYEVEETDADKDGYVTTATGDTGMITSDMAVAGFVNTKEDPPAPQTPYESDKPGKGPRTGDPANLLMWFILTLTSLGAVLTLMGLNRRRIKKSR